MSSVKDSFEVWLDSFDPRKLKWAGIVIGVAGALFCAFVVSVGEWALIIPGVSAMGAGVGIVVRARYNHSVTSQPPDDD